MRKQTNLAEVKLTALALLSTEINETPYSPMIVKHPFTDTGVSAIPDGKGGVEMIDLTEDDAQLRWRQSTVLTQATIRLPQWRSHRSAMWAASLIGDGTASEAVWNGAPALCLGVQMNAAILIRA